MGGKAVGMDMFAGHAVLAQDGLAAVDHGGWAAEVGVCRGRQQRGKLLGNQPARAGPGGIGRGLGQHGDKLECARPLRGDGADLGQGIQVALGTGAKQQGDGALELGVWGAVEPKTNVRLS